MIYTVIALGLAVLILAARLLCLRREIRRISKDLQDLNTDFAGKKLTIAVSHEPLETLCRQINNGIAAREKARIDAEKQEAELRAQISNISHDLRTPLTAILGYISMAKASPEKAMGYLETIEGRSKALQSLIAQFYELSVLEDAELVLEPVDITAALTNCLLGNYTLFEKKGITPKTSLPNQSVLITGNTQVLERIFQNLIQNALKFAEHSISISLAEERDCCVFSIANDAGNLTEADMEHLFERFYTADKSRNSGNTGLGLYIVKRLLEKIGCAVGKVRLKDGVFEMEIRFGKKNLSKTCPNTQQKSFDQTFP